MPNEYKYNNEAQASSFIIISNNKKIYPLMKIFQRCGKHLGKIHLSEKRIPEECSNHVRLRLHPPPPPQPFVACVAQYMEKRINFTQSVMCCFGCNSRLLGCQKTNWKTKGLQKYFDTKFQAKTQVDVTGLEEKKMVAGSAPCKNLGNKILFFITRKFFNVRCLFTMVKSGVYVKGV